MNIVVCVKYVPDAQADRGFEPDHTTDRVGVDGLLSELDEYAVEQALTIVEAGSGQVTVLTVGPEQAATAVKKSLQMGAGAGVHVQDDAIAGSDAVATSLVLAAAIRSWARRARSTWCSPAWRRPTARCPSCRRCWPSGCRCRRSPTPRS